MSTVKRGDDAEMLCAKTLEHLGFVVHVTGRDHAVGRKRYSHDLFFGVDAQLRRFGLFDLLAISFDDIRLVSVKGYCVNPRAVWWKAVRDLPVNSAVSYEHWALLGDGPVWRRWVCRSGYVWLNDPYPGNEAAGYAAIGTRALAATLAKGGAEHRG